MSDDQPTPAAAIEARLRAGEWVGVEELATLFGKHRTTIWRWAKHQPPLIAHSPPPSGGGFRFDPEDVLRFLAEWRKVHK